MRGRFTAPGAVLFSVLAFAMLQPAAAQRRRRSATSTARSTSCDRRSRLSCIHINGRDSVCREQDSVAAGSSILKHVAERADVKIRDHGGMTNMLVSNMQLGKLLAETHDDRNVALMRGHSSGAWPPRCR